MSDLPRYVVTSIPQAEAACDFAERQGHAEISIVFRHGLDRDQVEELERRFARSRASSPAPLVGPEAKPRFSSRVLELVGAGS